MKAEVGSVLSQRQHGKQKPTPNIWHGDSDISEDVAQHKAQKHTWPMFFSLSYRCIGVIYGDLTTSPLYTYPSVFTKQPSTLAIYGTCSLILYILLLQLIVKYILITLYADDNEEGGTFAVYSLLCRRIGITPFGEKQAYSTPTAAEEEPPSHNVSGKENGGKHPRMAGASPPVAGDDATSSTGARQKTRLFASYPESNSSLGTRFSEAVKRFIKGHVGVQRALLLLVLLGTSMLIGDGVLTCAIEVVSAVSGLEVKFPNISSGVVIGVSCVILVALFSIQWLGTSKLGFMFSPILIAWCLVNFSFGVFNVAHYDPGIMKAFNPAYGFRYLVQGGREAWISLGGVILCVTGCEAMFSDMGHFSRPAIQFVTLALVLPSCLMTYLGEAAYLLEHPEGYANPYFNSLPAWAFWPVLVLATLASIVSAQSLITATFSIVSQSVALNCFPAVEIVQTSERIAGQVYLPFVNWSLMIGSIAVVAAFQTTAKIGNAFGLAFISVMLVTTLMVTLIQLVVWRWNPFVTLLIMGFFFLLEGICASALCYKIPSGAWFPLALGSVILLVSYIWHYGASQRFAYSKGRKMKLASLIRRERGEGSALVLQDSGMKVLRVPGLAIYYSEHLDSVPESFKRLLYKTPVLHHTIVFITVRQVPLPKVRPEQRLLTIHIPLTGFHQVIARYGYQEIVDHGPEFIKALTAAIATALPPDQSGFDGSEEAGEPPEYIRSAPPTIQEGGDEDEGPSSSGLDHRTSQQPPESSSQDPQQSEGTATEMQPVGPTPGVDPEWVAYHEEWPSMRSLGGESEPEAPLLHPLSGPQARRRPQSGVVYVLSKPSIRARSGSSIWRRFLLETLYTFMIRNSRPPTAKWAIPPDDVLEMEVVHKA